LRLVSATRLMQAQARNNAWANHRLLHACAKLTQEEFTAPRTGEAPLRAEEFAQLGWTEADLWPQTT